jgi:quercetin dioxygenase-like cupin family protein
MQRILGAGVLAGALFTSAAAFGHGGPKITEKVLAAGSVAQPYTFKVDQPADVVVAKAAVPPGASFGWHSHRAAVVAVVKSGTLSLYDSADPKCTPSRIGPGKGFTEQPGHVHLARNEGTKPVAVVVTYVGLPHGVNPDVPAPRPGNCPF